METSILASTLENTKLDDNQSGIMNLFVPMSSGNETDAARNEQRRKLKERLLEATPEDIEYITTMLDERIRQGTGETVFKLGTEEDGTSMDLTPDEFNKCFETLKKVANDLEADATSLADLADKNTEEEQIPQTSLKYYIVIRKRLKNVEDILEVRVAVLGNVDAGKSTLLGVLTRGVLDDGRGKARSLVFRHKHEQETGRTSSVTGEIMCFNSLSEPVLHPARINNLNHWEQMFAKTSKVLSFVDLAGHEKYLKTTIFGITGNAPDFAMLMVGANAGLVGMTKEHLGLALSLGIPVLVVVTKIDWCPPHVLKNTIKDLTDVLKSRSCRKVPIFVENMEDVATTSQKFVGERICPIFQVSNVSGQGIDLLRNFLNLLPMLTQYDTKGELRLDINEKYSVPFVGTVVHGVLKSGTVHVGDKVLLGPNYAGEFTQTAVKGIHRKRSPVQTAKAGQTITLALKNVRSNAIHSGMVILPYDKDKPLPKATTRFEAEILVLHHATTITKRYQAMIHCGAVRQTMRIIDMDKEVMRTGDRARVQFEFIHTPEYLRVGERLIFREGRTKAVGKIIRLLD